MDYNEEHRTKNSVNIRRNEDGSYTTTVDGEAVVFESGLLNVGGRASAFPVATTVELGGGTTPIILRTYDDSRAKDGTLLAIGFEADAVL